MGRLMTLLALGALLSQLGCGGGSADVVELPVSSATGTVSLDGKPAEGVSLSFVPSGSTKGNGGYAVSAADGRFEVTSMDGRKGLPEGDYMVAASKMTMPDGSPIPPETSAADVGAVNALPEGYNDAARSSLKIKIQSGSNSDIKLDLKSRFSPREG